MVSSSVYPGLERKPGGPDNWVERAGGLPSYIERIAKHLHYEKGMTISHAIATAVNTVERWSRGGTVTKDGTTKRITPKTQALAKAAIDEWEAKKGISLAEPDIADTATMVCFRIPDDVANKIAVEGGVPADELHITLGYFGEVADQESVTEIERMVTECVQSYGEPLAGSIGGILAFPPAESKGVPWAATVDVPGISRLQLKLVEHFRGADYPIAENHGFTPHVSLAFDDPQEPLPAIPVSFGAVALVRGNELVAEIPLGDDDGADEPEDGTLSSDGAAPKEAKVELSAMLQRARTISDPEAKARVRAKILELSVSMRERESAKAKGQTISGTTSFPIRNETDLKNAIQAFGRAKDKAAAKKHIISRARSLGLTKLIPSQWKIDLAEQIVDGILDLALTKDGRKSFKKQGKWKHGFVPVDEKAVEAKAKGSPIATKRIRRLFGGVRPGPEKPPVAQDRTKKPAKRKPEDLIKVKGEGGGTVTAGSASLLGGGALTKDALASQRIDPKAKKEVSRGRGANPRATRAWDTIKPELKTIRNGKRYVIATFNGQQQLTEWVGPNHGEDVKADPSKVRYRTMSRATAAKFSSGELRNLLAVPGQPKNVTRVLNEALKKATAPKGRVPA